MIAISPGVSGPGFISLANPQLRPEQQTGFDGGTDVYFGSRASLQMTYYVQHATDLLDYEQVAYDSASKTRTYEYLNVPRVKNAGWELSGSVLILPALTLKGAYAITTSTVDRTGAGYTGAFLPGDPLLGVPRHSGGVTLTYALPRTTVSAHLTYVGSWVDTDYQRLYTDYFVNHVFTNPQRSYWITYTNIGRAGISATQRLNTQLSAFVQVDNLTNRQTGEQNNIFLEPGRTTTVGVHVTY